MATYIPLYELPIQFMDNSGDPLVGGTLEFYKAGTTTATEMYDDQGTSIGTSITLNSWGMPESGGNTITLFRDQSLAVKVVGKNASGATIFTSDNIPATAAFDSTSADKLSGIEAGADVTDATNVAAAGALMADGSVPLSGDLPFDSGAYLKPSTANALTASTTQTQGQGALTNSINEVTTVANTNDVVTLPAVAAGRPVIVINNGANTLQIFPGSDNYINDLAINASVTLAAGESQIFVGRSSTKWEGLVKSPTGAASQNYGSMYHDANTTAFTINAQTNVHAYHNTNVADGGSSGWTFDAGGGGTSVAIASIADGADSGVDIEVTTTGNHGLAVGDIISQTNLTDAAYEGIFTVKAIISNTQYEVEAVYTSTDTGTMDQAATLTLDSGAGGTYVAKWAASATSATSNEVFDYWLYKNTTALPGTSMRRKFGTASDYGSMSGISVPFTAAAGDKISFVMANNDSAGNITLRDLGITITEIL